MPKNSNKWTVSDFFYFNLWKKLFPKGWDIYSSKINKK